MQVTAYSMIMTVLWSNVLIVLFVMLRRNGRLLDICSVSGMVLLYLFCAVRMLIPVEFPWVIVAFRGHVFNGIQFFLEKPVFVFGETVISAGGILVVLWLVVAAGLLFRLAWTYRNMAKRIAAMPREDAGEAEAILAEDVLTGGSANGIEVIRSAAVKEPMCCGIVHGKILLPATEYPKNVLRNILRHEYMHLKNRDTLVQLLINILCMVYWWNPPVYLLRKDLDYTFELRCDRSVIARMDANGAAEYMEALVAVYKEKFRGRRYEKLTKGFLGSENEREAIRERFLIMDRPVTAYGFRGNGRGVAVVGMLAVLTLSYTFIFQPKIDPKEGEIVSTDGDRELRADESHVEKIGGAYYLVMPDGERMEIGEEGARQMRKDGFRLEE